MMLESRKFTFGLLTAHQANIEARRFWTGLIIFAMAITIPDREKQACSDLCRSAWTVLVLTNDYFSWDKEYRHATERGRTYFSNVICVIMRERSVSLEEAKEICKAMIR